VLTKDEVKLFEHGSIKMATFTLCRGAQFVVFDEIDQSVAKLVDGQQEVKVQLLIVAAGT
jgi:hypothetical protein